MVALAGRALFAGLLSLGRYWAPEERATAMASGLAHIGAGHADAARLVSEALAEYPGLAPVLPPDFDGPKYLPPLSLAAAAGNGELTSVLLGAGAAPNPRSAGGPGLGWTPLFLACREGHAEVAAMLVDVGGVHPADPSCVAAGGVTPLMAAAEGGHARTIELLLSRAPELDVNARDARGMTALHLAALRNRNGPVISALVRTGKADPWAAVAAGPEEGYAAFHLAVAHAALGSAGALWQTVGPAVLKTPTATGLLSPLHVAIEHGQQKSLEWLLQKLQEEEEGGAAVAAMSDRDGRTGATPLIYAIKHRNIAMVKALLAVAVPAHLTGEQDWSGRDALHTATALAAEDSHDEAAAAIVHLLLMAGASPTRRIAAHLPDSSPVCASPSRLPHEGWTAQALAVARGRLDLLALLSEGHPVADVALDAWAALAAKAPRDEGLRLGALDYVVRGAVRHADVVRALLAPGPSAAAVLDVACFEGQWDAAHALRQRGAPEGVSSLSTAVRGGQPELVRLLLGWMAPSDGSPDQELACGLRALAETALDSDLAAASGGSCVARRRAARRQEVVAVLHETLGPCEVQMAEEEVVGGEEEVVVHERFEPVVGPAMGTCAASDVEPQEMPMAVFLSLLFLVLICAGACHVTVRRLLSRRGSASVLEEAEEAAAVEESVPEEAAPEEQVAAAAVEEDEALSTPTSEEVAASPPPSPELVPAAMAEKAVGDGKEEGVEEQEEEEEDDESYVSEDEEGFSSDDEEDYSGLTAFTMSALVRGPVRLPPEGSRRLLEELGTSPEVFRRWSAPPAPAPSAGALSFAEEAGKGGEGAEEGGEGGDAAHGTVQALGEALEAEREKGEEPGSFLEAEE